MISLIDPSGYKEIIVSEDNTETSIFLEDRSRGERSFELSVRVTGNNSIVRVEGKSEGNESDKKQWKVSVSLEGENQEGHLSLKGVADGKSFLEFDGGGILSTHSHNGHIRVDEKVYLFSSQCRAKAIPVLRVETEHVKSASHSASIAPFSEELFFYLESRGISRLEGKNLMKSGILGDL